jgi:hypothetical protein
VKNAGGRGILGGRGMLPASRRMGFTGEEYRQADGVCLFLAMTKNLDTYRVPFLPSDFPQSPSSNALLEGYI